ncbi:glycosyltransferase [Spongiibacter sp. IMCC21906]|uniref:glycosyltransferase n=1 Tax=Spongiibacter sp. IMCC21906 TaxID=1620392 RepID=UPI00062DF275|nr:glycosyltransferase [Spongiibacter sp. IMCC21906]AKH68652.1 glycosyltransferase [Spongiibacter sp. IMCC21906]
MVGNLDLYFPECNHIENDLIEINMISAKLRVAAWPKEQNRTNNPYNYILYKSMSASTEVYEFDRRSMRISNENILHVHWPDKLVGDRRRWRMIWRCWKLHRAIKKLHKKGGKVVWTVHNLKPHTLRHPELANKLFEKFIDLVDGFIFLSSESRQLFFSAHREAEKKPHAVTPHLHYAEYYRLRVDQNISRNSIGIAEGQTVLLMFGKISEHKGLRHLIDAKQRCKLDNVRIIVAGGAASDSVTKADLGDARADPSFVVRASHVETEQVAAYFEMTDGVILPYTAILNSGTAVLALSLNRPVIAPDMGSFRSLSNEFGSDWVHLYAPPLDAEKLSAACQWLQNRQGKGALCQAESLKSCDPAVVAKQTEDFYRLLLKNSGH